LKYDFLYKNTTLVAEKRTPQKPGRPSHIVSVRRNRTELVGYKSRYESRFALSGLPAGVNVYGWGFGERDEPKVLRENLSGEAGVLVTEGLLG
jgi:hypothetical protein